MSADWEPPAEVVAAQATKWAATEAQLRRTVPAFREYWIAEGKRRAAHGWVRTWTNWLGLLAKKQELWVEDLRASSGRQQQRSESPPYHHRILR
jgi:hypothetical protein